MTEQELMDLVRQNIEAFSSGDFEQFAMTIAEDGVYEEPSTQRRVSSKTEAVDLAKGWRQAFPDARGTIQNLFASGDQAVAEILWEGTHQGDLETPAGRIPASGKRIEMRATQVLRGENGKLKETRHYLDLMTMLQQIGLTSRLAA